MPKGFAQLYVVAAIAFAGVLAYAGYQYQRAEASSARAEQAESRAAALTQAVEDSEAQNAALRQKQQALDAAIVERDKRARALEETKRKLQGELDALKTSLPQEDQDCLDRPLPPPLLERLRDH